MGVGYKDNTHSTLSLPHCSWIAAAQTLVRASPKIGVNDLGYRRTCPVSIYISLSIYIYIDR
jgi:hypothetical protein